MVSDFETHYCRFPGNLFGGTPYTGLGQHVSPTPTTPQVMATPSPRPSILRRKANDPSGIARVKCTLRHDLIIGCENEALSHMGLQFALNDCSTSPVVTGTGFLRIF